MRNNRSFKDIDIYIPLKVWDQMKQKFGGKHQKSEATINA